MTKKKLKLLSIWAAIGLLVADGCLALWASQIAARSPGWGQIAAALAMQLATLVVLVAWLARSDASSRVRDSALSYRRQLPVTLIGIVLVALALSLDLLYTAIVCPTEGIPVVRGRQVCAINLLNAA